MKIEYYLMKESLRHLNNNVSVKAYKQSIKKFLKWYESLDNSDERISYENSLEDRIKIVQEYTDYLVKKTNYTPETIHRYIGPVCKGYGFSMAEIKKPKRTSYERVRSRVDYKNLQGKKELNNPRFQRLVKFARVVGIRRAEYKRLLGSDLIQDKDGNYYILVRRGKGGKRQKQVVLPYAREIVLETFKGVGKDERVFSKEEMSNHMDLHGLRADASYQAYCYFLDKITKDIVYKKQLINALGNRWLEEHPDRSKESNAYIDYMEAITNPKPYKLRGENIEMAKKKGHPLEYNRVALMAISVFCLSHWRLSVTVTNYMC